MRFATARADRTSPDHRAWPEGQSRPPADVLKKFDEVLAEYVRGRRVSDPLDFGDVLTVGELQILWDELRCKNMRPKTCRDYKSAFKFLDIADVLDVPVADFGVAEMVKVKEAILDTPDRRTTTRIFRRITVAFPGPSAINSDESVACSRGEQGGNVPPSTVVAIKLAETELSMADDRVKPGRRRDKVDARSGGGGATPVAAALGCSRAALEDGSPPVGDPVDDARTDRATRETRPPRRPPLDVLPDAAQERASRRRRVSAGDQTRRA